MINLGELNNFPCRLTIFRAVSPLFIVPLALTGFEVWAFVWGVVAYLTDACDGYYARKYGLVTNTGRVIDPLADKILFYSLIIMFYQLVYVWLIVLNLALDCVSTALHSYEKDGSNNFGKYKTGNHIATLVSLSFYYMESISPYFHWIDLIFLAHYAFVVAIMLAFKSLYVRISNIGFRRSLMIVIGVSGD